MSSAEVDVTELVKLLEKYAAIDLAPFFASLSEDMASAVLDMFKSSGNGTWPTLAVSTAIQKLRKGKSLQPLVYNGTWMNSPTVESDATSATVGTNVPYAIFHVSDAPRSKIPLRNPYDLGQPFYDDATMRLADFIANMGHK